MRQDRLCQTRTNRRALSIAISTALMCYGSTAFAQTPPVLEEIVVLGSERTFSATQTTDSMQSQQAPITSVLSTIDNLPGVNVTEGDTFGFDDWSTTINLRGYQTNLSEQQVGITIDGFPNGESNYGGGSKANRYIDSANSAGVEVNQGTADISSRSLEALGGTLNFLTRDPSDTEGVTFQAMIGDFNARRYYGRYDTGYLSDNTTKAWISLSHQEATDWMEGSSQNQRDHLAGKFVSDFGRMALSGYISYDDIQEDNYQRITTAEFAVDPNWDRLTGDWTGLPYVDQLYRRGWSTLRKNLFSYLKLDLDVNDALTVNLAVYGHHMKGRGDWVPPQIIDVTNDGAGNPNSELTPGTTVYGGTPIGNIYFVDANGVALTPTPGCTSSITFPYGGAGPEYDPACYPAGAIPVQSYRHTHYERKRLGLTADFSYNTMLNSDIENTLRGGLWLEDSTRYEYRDWHKIIDARAGFQFENPAYWRQYDLKFPRTTFNYYLADTVDVGELSFSGALRQFRVDSKRVDNFGVDAEQSLNSNTDTLFSAGATYQMPIDGLEMFLGFSQNVKPLTDALLESTGTSTSNIEAETSDNTEIGLRYRGGRLVGSAVYFDNKFKNRLEFFGPQLAGNIPNYLIGTAGRYDNVGGIKTSGMELAGTIEITPEWSLYGAYTYTDATYIGTGLGAAADASLGLVPGNRVVGTPKSMFVVSLDWIRNNYSAGLSTKMTGDRYVDRANTDVAESYAVSDFYLNVSGSALSDALQDYEFSFVINNLTDESYLGGISGFGSWIGAPRTATFTMTLTF